MEKGESVLIDLKIYPIDAVYGAAYVFLDKAYIFLEEGGSSKVRVNIKPKEETSGKEKETLKEDFLNEVLNFCLRDKISRDNRQIREYIIATSLASAFNSTRGKTKEEDYFDDDISAPWENDFNEGDMEKEFGINEDPEGICIPWREKKRNAQKNKPRKRKDKK